MKVLITGHRGFIGQHLTKLLDEKKISWIGYDLLDGNDIRDKHNLDCFFELNQITNVIHLAARAGVRRSKLYPEEYISTNITGTQNVADLCAEHNAKLIFYSSSSVYGEQKLPVTEESPKTPISLYGITKLAGEQIVRNANCKTIIVRPFTVYGENGRKDEVIYKWLEQIKVGKPITVYGDGTSSRGYVYVGDLVRATVGLLNHKWEHADFNLGGSEIIHLQDILAIFEEFFDLKIEQKLLPPEDIYQQYTDISKAKNLLGFEPQPNFIKNLKRICGNQPQKDNREK